MPDTDRYLDILQHMIDAMAEFVGDKVALKYARQAPLDIDPDGTVNDFYGEGGQAVSILLGKYEDYMGASVADARLRSALRDLPEDRHDLLPERIRPGQEEDKGDGLLHRFRTMLGA
ncbi:MAG: hypothetical protein ABEK12_01750 [Candidatus Nanohaloarchaea archaeon]